MRDVIPTDVLGDIQRHIRRRCADAEEGWQSASADEDVLTGDLGGTLRTGWKQIGEKSDSSWRWRATYQKFRGRGKGAAEKIIGADGIVQVEVEEMQTGDVVTKGMLFQAKKADTRDPRLRDQVEKMERVAPNGGAVFEYGPRQYRGVASSAVLQNEGRLVNLPDAAARRLGDFLADRFLPCETGLRGMYYDAVRGELIVPSPNLGARQFRVELINRIRFEVQKLT